MSKSWQQKFEEAVKRHNGTDEDLCLLGQPEGNSFIDKTAKDLVAFGAMQRSAHVVPVDYDLSHESQINEAGFSWVTDFYHSLILKPPKHLYPLPSGLITQRIALIHLDRPAKNNAVLERMNELHVRPVLSPEFLALIKAFPDLQHQCSLVGLGSVWALYTDGNRGFLYACEDLVWRNLNLCWGDIKWGANCRFPAVCL